MKSYLSSKITTCTHIMGSLHMKGLGLPPIERTHSHIKGFLHIRKGSLHQGLLSLKHASVTQSHASDTTSCTGQWLKPAELYKVIYKLCYSRNC